MTLTIQALKPKHAKAYVDYLEQMDFHHAPDWSGCFCRFYHTDCSNDDWQKRSASQNKEEALQAIQAGTMKGFLAFEDDHIVGWLNANAIQAYPRLASIAQPYCRSSKTGTVVCFVIHPQFRHQGIATKLLSAAVESFEKEGMDVLAFPFESEGEPQKAYRGFIPMYLNLGFKVLETREGMSLLRKDVNA